MQGSIVFTLNYSKMFINVSMRFTASSAARIEFVNEVAFRGI